MFSFKLCIASKSVFIFLEKTIEVAKAKAEEFKDEEDNTLNQICDEYEISEDERDRLNFCLFVLKNKDLIIHQLILVHDILHLLFLLQ